mmetsp:Transcript_29250/g.28002  ORF Transcript_29250/g.28002 Transcript_29250/m.28002 type:complete len:148 (+) Transcript_29250:141-584(+)
MKVINVEVKESWIDSSFHGLFATEMIQKQSAICEYRGDLLTTVGALRTTDKSYLMRLSPQIYIDAKHSPECLARYINDCRNPLGYNATFDKRPEDLCALVIATRDIMKGEEIFVDYGRWYWLSLSPKRLSLADLLILKGLVPPKSDP